jgi:phosphatidylglycerol:prolipoprotein diacylglycerol transferase
MYPELSFSLFGTSYTIFSYDLFAVLAILSVITLTPLSFLRAKKPFFKGLALSCVLLIIFVVGSRLLNYFINPIQYGDNFALTTIDFKGFSLYGGLILSGLALPFVSKAFGIKSLEAADRLTLPCGIAFILSRMGCFLNGCCAGKSTKSILGVTFPLRKAEKLIIDKLPFSFGFDQIRVYPTQLFELIIAALGLFLIPTLSKRFGLKTGSTAILYAMWFTAMRLGVLPLRSLPYAPFVVDVFYPVIYVTIILFCLALFCKINLKTKSPNDKTKMPE